MKKPMYIAAIVVLLIVFFVSLSGMYFINSIVTPVAAISATARRICGI